MSEPFRLRYVNQIVGAVLLITLLILLALGLYVIRGRYLFARSINYQVAIPQEMFSDLRRGSDVVILGEVIGRVHQIAYAADSQDILLDLKIKEPFRDQILHDSMIEVRRKFGVGEPYLEILRGRDVLGLVLTELSTERAATLDWDSAGGAVVAKLFEHGSAAQAGLREGDVIVNFGGRPIKSGSQLADAMAQVEVGQTIELEYRRQGEPPTQVTVLAQRSPGVPLGADQRLSIATAQDERMATVADQANMTMRDFQSLTRQTSEDMEQTFVPSFNEFETMSKSVRITSDELRPAAAETFENVDEFIVYLKKQMDELMLTVNSVVDEDARPMMQDVSATMQNLDALIDELGPAAVGTLEELDLVAQNLNNTLRDVDEIVAILQDEARSLPGTVPELRQVIRSTNEIAAGIRNSRLIGGMINRGNRSRRGNNRRAILQRRRRR